jgi:hypothetical protein
MNTFFWSNSKLPNILLCVFLKTVISKYWEHSFIEHDWKHRISKYQHLFKWDILLNNNIKTLRVQLMHTHTLYLLHFTSMFDYNYTSYFILSWNLNSLHILFLNNIHYTCMNTRVVCHSIINQIMNGWRLTESVLYFIQYATLKYNYIEYQRFKYLYIYFIWQLFVFQ